MRNKAYTFNIYDAIVAGNALTDSDLSWWRAAFTISGIPAGETDPISCYTYSDVLEELSNYGEYFVLGRSDDTSYGALVTKFAQWRLAMDRQIASAYSALYNSTYDPIHNYDGTETTTITITGTETNKRTPDLTDTLTHGETISRSNDLYGVNSTDGRPSDTSSEGHTGDDKNTTSGTDTYDKYYSDDYVHTTTIEKGGNLGVVTTQQMINAEIELRRKNLIATFIRDFIDEYCFLLGSEYLEEEL